MSLLSRLLISVTLALAVILVGTLGWSVTAARQYLDGQLESEGDNAASALALSLSQPANQDAVTRELLMMALFDTGKFDAIAFTDVGGKPVFEREQAPQAHYKGQAPAWFAQLLPLSAPRAQREVSDGWKQVGQLSLTVNNGYAYDALWHSSTRMALLVLVAGLAWALFVAGLIRWFRRLLRQQVEAQVMAIGKQAASSDALGTEPDTGSAQVAELASVVSAIHATRERVRATAQEQGERIESLQLELHSDPVTGLANRRYFINELRRMLGAPAGSGGNGHLMLFRQRDLLAVNAQLNHAGADAWLATVGQQVKAVLAGEGSADHPIQLARLNGSDFIVLIPRVDGLHALTLVERIRQTLEGLRVMLADARRCRWAYALTDYTSGSAVGEVLARLDQALMRAESAGHDEVEFLTQDDAQTGKPVAAQGQWQQMLEQALSTPGALSLRLRPLALDGQRQTLQQEASLALHAGDGSTLGGALFLPVAVRLGLSGAFDAEAIKLGLAWLAEHADDALVVRISLPSLAQPRFQPQVQSILQAAAPQTTARLVLELDAYALQTDAEEVATFAREVTACGAGMALRRLDQSPMALAQLHALTLRYVKLGGDFAEQALASPGTRQLLIAMLDTARGLQVPALVPALVAAEAAVLLRERGANLLVDAP
ncbi:MAG: diguanylate cyclase [Comamonas sp. SCN 65-56]|uniref:bifunctional diguanylate cyclase/phosphodiesterase n=1 Tax=Comamonas sp. SCN 65-56 TaxID=1660095 RepID=UPI00086A23A5|nr:LapD/MoxY N-terminal periplasmic domain-containing protein [Comamonas sp. SCN 65-56]ODS93830.1 MAG: diguanylate cyclase [Comamonas sp. SCN 65-56]